MKCSDGLIFFKYVPQPNLQTNPIKLGPHKGEKMYVMKVAHYSTVGALVSLNKAFPLTKAFIITYDEEETIETSGLTIEVLPIWKWLLEN